VLDAERSLFQAQIQLAQTQAQLYFALINLHETLGGGWVDEADRLAPAPRCISGANRRSFHDEWTIVMRRWGEKGFTRCRGHLTFVKVISCRFSQIDCRRRRSGPEGNQSLLSSPGRRP
jgi:hypothetical protein